MVALCVLFLLLGAVSTSFDSPSTGHLTGTPHDTTGTHKGQGNEADGVNITDQYLLSVVEHFFHHGFGRFKGLFRVPPTAENSSSVTSAQDNETIPHRANKSSGSRRKERVGLSLLPYMLRQPYLTVIANDFHVDDKVVLYMSVAYKHQVSCAWYLNNRSFDEHNFLQNMDIRPHESETDDNDTDYFRVCHVEVNHLFKLPTTNGKYQFTCSVSVDSEEKEVIHVLAPLVSDTCPPANCSHRNAVCQDGKCVCDGSHPVKLNSTHTTCRTESYLEDPCYYGLQCLYTTQNSECVKQGWCACRPGYGRNTRHECEKKVGVNARCDSDAECDRYNATCILSRCTCHPRTVEENSQCVDFIDLKASVKESFASVGGAGLRQPIAGRLLLLAFLALWNAKG